MNCWCYRVCVITKKKRELVLQTFMFLDQYSFLFQSFRLPPFSMSLPGAYAAQLLASPDDCREQMHHAVEAYRAMDVPAPDGGFPAWEYTDSTSSRARSSSPDLLEPSTLRVVGRVRAPRPCEGPHVAVVEVAFRGTKNVQNWLSNFAADLTPLSLGGSGGCVHRGFQDAYLTPNIVKY